MSRFDRRRRVVVGTALGIGATVAMVPSAQAADFTVTTTADSGAGSLREAIAKANLTPAISDRILFQSGLSGTISLQSDLPTLASPISIVGPGINQLTIDGGGNYAIFDTYAASPGNSDLSVSGLTLAHGRSDGGGAIGQQSGDLIVDKTKVEGGNANVGGGIAMQGGHLTLSDSEITGNSSFKGGGLYVHQTQVAISGTTFSGSDVTSGTGNPMGGGAYLSLVPGTQSTIKNSVFSGNSAPIGAGLTVQKGNVSIDSTLFSGNQAAFSVGGLVLGSPYGSGTNSYSVTNSTFTGNKAPVGAGIAVASNATTIASSTISGNTSTDSSRPAFYQGAGVIALGARAQINNSIVSGNSPTDLSTNPAMTNPVIPAGSISGSFDLIGSMPSASFTETVPGSNITSTDPQLGALADNGGPTETMLPAVTSPVVNQGSSALTTDARGLTRPVNYAGIPFSTAAGANGADIGAVELQYTPPPPPPPPSNAFSFGWIKLNKKKGIASLQVKVPGAGKVLVEGSKTVAKFSKAAKKSGIVTVTIKAKGKARKKLKKKGKAKVKAKVKFTPTGGKTRTKSKTVKLVKKKHKKKKKKSKKKHRQN